MTNKFLEENYYITVPEFVETKVAYSLSQSFKEFCTTKNIKEDDQVPGSQGYYNYLDFVQLLVEKTSEVGRIIGEPVLPTYAYSRVYKNGCVLDKHIDRNACEVSLTVHLSGDKEWPIAMKSPRGIVKYIDLKPGDAVLYYGPKIEHWRDRYDGNEYIQVFLHYVKTRGKHSHLMFDSAIRTSQALARYRNNISK